MEGILQNNKDLELIFVTRKKFAPYFTGIDRITVIPFDPDHQHKGFWGIWKLFRETRQYSFRQVVDLHGIMRTWILDVLYLLTGCRVHGIRKHRALRKKVLNHKNPGIQVPQTTDRYLDVFRKACIEGNVVPCIFQETESPVADEKLMRIGIAPLSKHPTKNWGLDSISELIRLLKERYPVEIHLFGGKEDQLVLEVLEDHGVFNHSGKLSASEEIALMLQLDAFLSMDSANMHLASLIGIPTLSVWGATDPSLGFAPLFQPDSRSLRANPAEVTCRPCSVYGEKPCKRYDSPMLCMKRIEPGMVFDEFCKILTPPVKYYGVD